ncbi:SDR family NAD(P)-dependent oxidoreductase [Nonomuraea ferruginea]
MVRFVRAAIPPMLARGGGSIVNVSSGSARLPAPMNVDYSAAKAALNNVTKALSEEYAPPGHPRQHRLSWTGAHGVVDRGGRRGRHHRRTGGRRP